MRVFLIDPPLNNDRYSKLLSERGIVPPLWMLSVGTYLKSKLPDIELKLFDGAYQKTEEIIEDIDNQKPEFVGLSPMLLSYNNTLSIARAAKKVGARVILGGHHATGLRREIILNRGQFSNDYCIDAVIQQDGERAFYEYVSSRELKNIKNLVYQSNNREIIENSLDLLCLDELPIANRGLIDRSIYKRRTFPINMASIFSQKGCAWRTHTKHGCIFCSRMDKELRTKNPERVWEEINYLVKDFNVHFIWDVRDDFLDNPEWLYSFHQESRKHKQMPVLRIFARADRINRDTIRVLKEVNVKQVILGIESGDVKSLATMRKGLPAESNLRAVKILNDFGVKIIACFVLGAPKESVKSLFNTFIHLSKIKRLTRLYAKKIYLLTPYPNSYAFDLLKNKIGAKYEGKDLLDWDELTTDWLKNFCDTHHIFIKIAARLLKHF